MSDKEEPKTVPLSDRYFFSYTSQNVRDNLGPSSIEGPVTINKNTIDNLNKTRQDNKFPIGPFALLKIFGYSLQIGKEKGYKDGSWWTSEPPQNWTQLMSSAKRHMEAVESGLQGSSVEYTELDKNGEACPTPGNHIYAAFWNIAVIALQYYFRKHQNDDRWLRK